jgi:hypothetical protein
MRSGIQKISSRVLECCSSLPPIVNLMLRGMWIRDFIFGYAGPRGREDIEAIPQRPSRGGHWNVTRAHVIHDRVTEDVFLPSVRENVFAALADDKCKFSFVVRLLGESRQYNRRMRSVNADVSFRKSVGTFGIA